MSEGDGSNSSSPSNASNDFQFKADIPLDSIATADERDALIAARPKPALEIDYTPEGATTSIVNQNINKENEARIQKISNSLTLARDKLHAGIEKTNADFEHDR